jgi:hypothetical protein
MAKKELTTHDIFWNLILLIIFIVFFTIAFLLRENENPFLWFAKYF